MRKMAKNCESTSGFHTFQPRPRGVLRGAAHPILRAVALALCLAAFHLAMAKGQGGATANGSNAQAEAKVNPRPIRVSLMDGNDIRFSRISTAAGLSQTRVAQIVQDDQGFMWFGTQYGLNRYDGYNIRTFTPEPGSGNTLSGAYIYSLFKDRSGIIWVGCDKFLDRFDPATEIFTHYQLPGDDANYVPATVFKMSQDRTGELWLATGRGLYGMDPVTGRITHHYTHDPLDPASLSSNDVRATNENRSGEFWVADGHHLEQLDRATGKVTRRVSLTKTARDFSFYEDHSGKLWICSSGGGGLAALDPDTNTLTGYSFYDMKSGENVSAGVDSLVEDENGTLWLGTMGAGLLKFDPEHESAIRYRNHPHEHESLVEDGVIALAKDREGNIWVGLHASEPNFFANRTLSFGPLLREGFNSNSLGENLVNAIYEDPQGILWVGITGSLIRIDRRTGAQTSYRPPGTGAEYEPVAIAEDHSGIIWIGTVGQGLDRFDPGTGQFKTYLHDPADPSSVSNNVVGKLFVDHAGTLWVGTWDGLDRFDPATGRFIVYRRSEQNRSEYYYDITEDPDGGLWVGGISGLQHFDPATGKFQVYEHNLDDPRSLSDNRITSVHVDHSGTVWAATESGLDKLNRATGTFTNYYVRDGLPSNRVHCILEDQHGDLWISTSQGVSRFNPQSRVFHNYSVADGLPGVDMTGWQTCQRGPTGEMYFGGFSGATAFQPDKVVDNSIAPPMVFTDFRLAGVSVKVGGRSPLQQSISYARSLVLSHRQSNFSLEFSALTYSNSLLTRYRYMLEGLDSDWHDVGSEERLVSYNNLPAGKFVFRAQGATSSGPWSEPGVALQIEILPPWWGTLWFKVVWAVSLVLLAGSASYYRLNQVAQRFNVRLEERTRIARDLHDTLLQSFQGLMLRFQTVDEMLPTRPLEAKKALEAALDRADKALVEGRDAIKDMRTSTLVDHDLVQSMNALMTDLHEELTTGNRDSVAFQVQVEGAPRAVHPTLRDEIYRIARESLRNAFRHAQARNIETEITYSEPLLRLRFRDDGKGIDPHVLEHGGRSGHWGLPGMRERANHIGAKLDIWSKPGAGTEVDLSIPGSIAYEAFPSRAGFRFFVKRKDRSHEHRS
jgi:ligand-binding sensor domain-containing protein/signal transduction histidine kinase